LSMARPTPAAVSPVGSRGWFDDHPEVRFPLRCAVTTLLAAAAWAALGPAWPAFERATALLVVGSARLVGISARADSGASGAFDDRGFRFVIADGCTGLSLVLIYVAAVLAFPATSRQRLSGLRVGVPVLFGLNLFRLVFLGWVGARNRSLFETLHLVWFQLFFIAAVGAMWFAWAWRIRGDTGAVTETPRLRQGLL